MAQTKHWRPQLFSALGTGFENDNHLRDGIHLRWSADPRLGLPLYPSDKLGGLFRVYYLHDGFQCLRDLDLQGVKNNPTYSVRSSLNANGQSGIDAAYNSGSRFFKKIDPDLNSVIWQYYTLTQWLQNHQLTAEEKDLLNYLNGVMEQIRPELYDANWAYEIGEVTAVDAIYKLTGSAMGEYAWVRGYDRSGRLIAEDWIGRIPAGTKGTARLRSPHIYSIRVEPVKGMPPISQQEILWIFSDDYSRAGIWRESGVERRFELKESAYTKEMVTDFYYTPFKVDLDWSETTNQLLQYFIYNPLMAELLNQGNTYQLSRYAADLSPENPADQQTFPNVQVPVLASLIHSAVDPVMANILGLYAWNKTNVFPAKRDYKVEAYLPFFNESNLIFLRDQLLAMAASYGVPITTLALEKLTGLPLGTNPEGYTRSTALCGLVLCPELDIRESPHRPESFATLVKTIDLLSQDNPNQAEIYVNSRLQLPLPPFTTEPHLQPVSYQVERRLSDSDFANVMDMDDKPDPLEQIGVIPAIYLPKRIPDQDYWELRDDFRLPVVQEDAVQYRLTAFDIFGRPSDPGTGTVEPITIPCYEPTAATSLTAQVNPEQNDLNMELYFAISGTIPPLHAVPQTLDITIHAVNPLDPAPVEQITWSGTIPARTFTVNYLSDGSYLNRATLTPGCASLSWDNGQLVRTPLPAGSCDAAFPLNLSTLLLEAPLSPMIDESDTGYRLYRLQTQIGQLNDLDPGLYRWCVRVRIVGQCESGEILPGRDVAAAAQHIVQAPPPAVVQPPLVAIPESTYPDRQGDAYYNLDLSQYIPAALANSNPMVNIYRVQLPQLTPTPEAVVDGDYFAPGGDELIQNLARNGRRHFQRVNEVPVIYTPANRFYPIPARGDLEEYHVIGVIGCNAQLDEKDWQQAAVLLFKTPKPITAPPIRFISVRPQVVGDEVHVTLDYHADFESELPAGTPLPKVQIMRHDLSTGSSRFAGETTGVWDTAAGGYHFTFTDARASQWRRYRYEASLMFHAGKWGQIIKSTQTTDCKVLIPETGAASPYATGLAPTASAVNGQLALTFPFMAGDFSFSITKVLPGNATIRTQGQFYGGQILGVPNAGLTINRSAGQYTLSYLDDNTQPGTYTLRLWQGQKAAWPQKLEVS